MNRYQTHFKNPYKTLEKNIKTCIDSNAQILDIGSNSGTIAGMVDKYHKNCLVHCVDIDEESLGMIEENPLNSTRTLSYHSDANDFLSASNVNDLDAIIINAALHEINDPSNQRDYLRFFFESCRRKMKKSGLIIIGDYYYPDHVSKEAAEDHMKQQLREINHADSREKFIQPSLIWQIAMDSGLYVQKQIEIPAVKGIDKRYYNIIIRGEENGN